jgi:hypothetical protein
MICGFLFTWTPYAVTLFVSAFRGKDYAISPLVTFFCACFAKSSVIWIPLLYIGTSTQFKLSFVNLNALHNQTDSNHIQNEGPPTFVIVHNNDGSILVRTTRQLPVKRKS